MPHGARHAVARHDDHVVLVTAPPLEYCEAETSVQHARGGKHNHGTRVVNVGSGHENG